MIERGRGIALWRQIERQLADDITMGLYPGGSRLPTEPELAERFGVNRHTLRRAIAALAEQGLVRVEQGRGSFVQEDLVDYMIGRRTRFSEIISSLDRTPSGRLLRAYETPADSQIAKELGLKAKTLCIFLQTLNEVDGQPVSVGTSYFPAKRFPQLIPVYSETRSITRALEHHGVGDYVRRTTRVTARMPDVDDAAHLRQSRSRPILVVESINVDREGVPVQYGVGHFASDRIQLVFET